MGHSHSSSALEPSQPRPALATFLTLIVLAIAAAAIAGMIALWPDAKDVPKGQNPYTGEGVTTVDGTVVRIQPFNCNSGGEGPDQQPSVAGDCAKVTASTTNDRAVFKPRPGPVPRRHRGRRRHPHDPHRAPRTDRRRIEFLDFRRGLPLTALAIVFALLVVAVARWRGLFALVGIAVTMLALTKFILPAMLAGESPLPVAVVGSTVIMIAVLYLAHGISIRTTSALFGTLVGIVLTAAIGLAGTGWANLSGVGTENDQTLVASAPELRLSGVVAATW